MKRRTRSLVWFLAVGAVLAVNVALLHIHAARARNMIRAREQNCEELQSKLKKSEAELVALQPVWAREKALAERLFDLKRELEYYRTINRGLRQNNPAMTERSLEVWDEIVTKRRQAEEHAKKHGKHHHSCTCAEEDEHGEHHHSSTSMEE